MSPDGDFSFLAFRMSSKLETHSDEQLPVVPVDPHKIILDILTQLNAQGRKATDILDELREEKAAA